MARTWRIGLYLIASVSLLLGPSTNALAHSVRQRLSRYDDNQGIARERLKLDSALQYQHEGGFLTGSQYGLSLVREHQTDVEVLDDQLAREAYGGGDRLTDTVVANLSQTWAQLSDSRLLASYGNDGQYQSLSLAAGVSRWILRESIQLSLDFSQTRVDRPVIEVLGSDSDFISPPSNYNSRGIILKAKHLATRTTVTEYSVTHIESNDRAPANIAGFAGRQYLPISRSAIHLSVAYADNKGRVTHRTPYGSVDAWIFELAGLQNLWAGAHAKVSYRYYNEKEETRTHKEQLTRGTDMIGVFMAQELTRRQIDGLSFPVTVEFGGQRYLTNELDSGEKLIANVLEFGVSAKL